MYFLVGLLLGAFILYLIQEKKYKKEIKENEKDYEKKLEERDESLSAEGKMILAEGKNELSKQLKEDLNDFKNNILKDFRDDLEGQKEKTIQLNQQLINYQKNYDKLTDSIDVLSGAMGGHTRHAGEIGEYLLEDLLINHGLVKGEHFYTQKTTDGVRPDVVLKMGSKEFIIDSKFITKKYLDYVKSKDESDLKEHVAQLKATIRNLSKRAYQKKSKSSYDQVFMYIPIDDAFLAAARFDRSLGLEARRHNVMVVSPFFLVPYIEIISRWWNQGKIEESHQKLIDIVEAMYSKYYGVLKNVNTARKAMDDLHVKLEGKGGFKRKLKEAEKMGINPPRLIEEKDSDSWA